MILTRTEQIWLEPNDALSELCHLSKNQRQYLLFPENLQLQPIGIDFGTVNIITMGNNIGLKPIAIKDDGTGIKSINQFYNKKKAELQSIYGLQGIKCGSKMDGLTQKRNLKIKDAMHKISRYIIDYCIEHNICTLVIGYNENWKQEAELGRRNNQNFVPHKSPDIEAFSTHD